MTITIRRATAEEVQTFSALAVRTFTETCGALYAAEDRVAFIAERYAADKQATSLAEPEYAAWLVEDNGIPLARPPPAPAASRTPT